MKKGWTEVTLGEVFDLDLDAITVDPSVLYDMAGVLSYGRGLFVKPPVGGSETSYKTFYRLRRGQIVLSQLFGWEGAIAAVTDDYDGRFVSSQFPTFRQKPNLVEGFARWLIRNGRLWDQLRSAAKGMGDRRRTLSPEIFLSATSVLPPLAEQRSLVARLGAIESRLNRVQALRVEEQKERSALVTSMAHRWDLDSASKRARNWRTVALGEVLEQASEVASVDSSASYPNLGIYSYGRGTFTKAPIEGTNTSATQLFRVRSGQFIYSRLFAFEGAYALVRPSQDGHFVSNEFPSFNIDTQHILPEFLFAYFKSPTVWTDLAEQSTGLGSRRQRIHPEVILAHSIELPPIEYQSAVRDAFKKLEIAEAAAGNAELDALFPSLLDSIFKS